MYTLKFLVSKIYFVMITFLLISSVSASSTNLDRSKVQVEELMTLTYQISYIQDIGGDENDIEGKGEEVYTIKEIDNDSNILIINIERKYGEPLNHYSNYTYPNRLDVFGDIIIYTDWEYWKENISSVLNSQLIDNDPEGEFEFKISDSQNSFGVEIKEYYETNSFGRISIFYYQSEQVYDKTYGILIYRYERHEETGPNGITLLTENTKTLSTNLNNDPKLELNGSAYLITGLVVMTMIVIGLYLRAKFKIRSDYSIE